MSVDEFPVRVVVNKRVGVGSIRQEFEVEAWIGSVCFYIDRYPIHLVANEKEATEFALGRIGAKMDPGEYRDD